MRIVEDAAATPTAAPCAGDIDRQGRDGGHECEGEERPLAAPAEEVDQHGRSNDPDDRCPASQLPMSGQRRAHGDGNHHEDEEGRRGQAAAQLVPSPPGLRQGQAA